jgi:macrolide resistance protein
VLAAGVFSRIANAAAAVAYPWLALDLGGPELAGIVAAAIFAPAALGHVAAGVAVERFGVRATALTGEGASALSALAIAALAGLGHLTAPAFVALAAIGALLDGPARAANQARWPEIARIARVPLPRAAALDASADHFALLLGPPAAGLAIAGYGAHAAVWLVGGLALLGFGLVLLSLPRFRPRGGQAATLKGIGLGLNCILKERVLWSVTAIISVAMAAFSSLESVVLPALAQAGAAGPEGLTAYLAAAGLGALAGSVAMAAWGKTPPLNWFFLCALLGMAAGAALLAWFDTIEAMAIAGLVIGLSYGGLGPALNVAFLTLPPVELRAHVGGVSSALSMALMPAAAVAAGFGFTALGGAAMVLLSAGVLATLALASIAMPDLPKRA